MEETKEKVSVLIAVIAGSKFAFETSKVEEVVPIMAINIYPDAPSFLEGFIDVRGRIYNVVDLRKRFNAESGDYLYLNRIILTTIDSKKIGFVVDEIFSVEVWEKDIFSRKMFANEESFSYDICRSGSEDIQGINLHKVLGKEEIELIQGSKNMEIK